MPTIQRLLAREILDSRGRPTVQTTCRLAGDAEASASVPSGASTGIAEMHELRDGDHSRFGGLGCRRAVANVGTEIQAALGSRQFDQDSLDAALVALDGTPMLSRLGANAILSVSLAFARACAVEHGAPLFRHFAELAGIQRPQLPRLTINLFSGGKHAGGQVPIQDVLVAATSAHCIGDALSQASAIYDAATQIIARKYNARPLKADEGGLAPSFPDATTMLDDAVEAIRRAKLIPGRDVALAIDVAASHFYHDEQYQLGNESLDSAGMIARLVEWLDRFPITSIEDGLAQDDWDNWPKLRAAAGHRALVMGDDLLCTNPSRIERAIKSGAANALLLKVNQIGTLSGALRALKLARNAGWSVTASARSGETEDDWLADLAVGWNADFIKIGSIRQSDRLAKYNRLLKLESELASA